MSEDQLQLIIDKYLAEHPLDKSDGTVYTANIPPQQKEKKVESKLRRICCICSRRRLVNMSGRCNECQELVKNATGAPCEHQRDVLDMVARDIIWGHVKSFAGKLGFSYDANVHQRVTNLQFLGNGMDRVGYLMPCDHVLKISYHADGSQTYFEGRKWANADDTLKLMVAPVLEYDGRNGLWLTMPFCEGPIGRAGLDDDSPWWQEKVLLEAKLAEYDIGDQHNGNVGWLDGALVSLDYGLGSYKYKSPKGYGPPYGGYSTNSQYAPAPYKQLSNLHDYEDELGEDTITLADELSGKSVVTYKRHAAEKVLWPREDEDER